MEKKGGLFNFIRNTSFLSFFAAWIIGIFVFAAIYWIVSAFTPLVLESMPLAFTIEGLFRSIYASFLIATIFGLSKTDFVGIMATIVYVQLAFSILVIFILLDKAVQKYIAPHYHNATRHEKKVNTSMLMMSIFRHDADRIMHEFKTRARSGISLKEIEALIDGLYVTFLDIEKQFSHDRHKMRDMHYLMLAGNIESSLEKLSELIDFLEARKIEWKDKSIEFWIRYILETADKITVHIDGIKSPKVMIAVENIREYAEDIEKKL